MPPKRRAPVNHKLVRGVKQARTTRRQTPGVHIMQEATADVSVCLGTILASPSCQNCLFGKCDQDGECTDGCEPGFADIFCQQPCQETCTNGRCMVDNRTGTTMCTEGCVDGFCYPGCKIPCPEGCLRCNRMLCENCTLCESHLYGENCQHSCLDKCKGYACSIQGNCSQDTCMGGRYGKLCSSSCKPRYESCHQESGHCVKCRRGLFGDDCQDQCPQECLTRQEEDMFRCRSGCKLCNKSPQSEPNKECDCEDKDTRPNAILGLCIALIVITVSSLCFHMKNAFQGKCGNVAAAERRSGSQTRCYENRTYSGLQVAEHQRQLQDEVSSRVDTDTPEEFGYVPYQPPT